MDLGLVVGLQSQNGSPSPELEEGEKEPHVFHVALRKMGELGRMPWPGTPSASSTNGPCGC